jgi:hypothetical protein
MTQETFEKIKENRDDYPDGFFDLFGSAQDDTMVRPAQPDFAADATQEEI